MTRRIALEQAAAIIAKAVPDIAHLISLLEQAGLRRLAEALGTRPTEVGLPQLARAEVLRMWLDGKLR
jgi:hypothetical protein